MPRAKKAPSEAKPKQSGADQNTAGITSIDAPRKTNSGISAPGKTDEASGKPVTSVNAQGANAGVKSNGHSDTDLEAAIRARAYEIWERRGRPEGAGHDDWLQAEREIRAEYDKRTA